MTRMCKCCNEIKVDKYNEICEVCYKKKEKKERREFFVILFSSITFLSLFFATIYTFRDVIKHVLQVGSYHIYQFINSLPIFLQTFLGVFFVLLMIVFLLWMMHSILTERWHI